MANTKMFRSVTAIAERIVFAFDRIGQYMLPLLMALIVLDVVGRRLLSLPTVAIQEAEWHVHGVLFLFCIAGTYLRDGHVRVDLIRENLASRAKAIVETVGNLLFLFPYMLVLLWFGVGFAVQSYISGDSSPAAEGLGARWIIKSALPVGFMLMIAAGVVTLAKLHRPRDQRQKGPEA